MIYCKKEIYQRVRRTIKEVKSTEDMRLVTIYQQSYFQANPNLFVLNPIFKELIQNLMEETYDWCVCVFMTWLMMCISESCFQVTLTLNTLQWRIQNPLYPLDTGRKLNVRKTFRRRSQFFPMPQKVLWTPQKPSKNLLRHHKEVRTSYERLTYVQFRSCIQGVSNI